MRGDGCFLGFLNVSVIVFEDCFVGSSVSGVLGHAPSFLQLVTVALGGPEL